MKTGCHLKLVDVDFMFAFLYFSFLTKLDKKISGSKTHGGVEL